MNPCLPSLVCWISYNLEKIALNYYFFLSTKIQEVSIYRYCAVLYVGSKKYKKKSEIKCTHLY